MDQEIGEDVVVNVPDLGVRKRPSAIGSRPLLLLCALLLQNLHGASQRRLLRSIMVDVTMCGSINIPAPFHKVGYYGLVICVTHRHLCCAESMADDSIYIKAVVTDRESDSNGLRLVLLGWHMT